jgi:hypothetical protein
MLLHKKTEMVSRRASIYVVLFYRSLAITALLRATVSDTGCLVAARSRAMSCMSSCRTVAEFEGGSLVVYGC